MALLIAAAAMPLLAIGAVLILLRLQRQERALTARIAVARGRRESVLAVTGLPLAQPGVKPGKTLVARLASVIGFDPARRDQYGLPWFAVLGVTAVTGRIAVLLATSLVGPLAWLLLPMIVIGGSRAYYAGANRKRRNLLLVQFPDSLALIVRAVRVGIPVSEALRAVAREMPEPTRSEFRRLESQIAMGSALETALRTLAQRNDLPEYGFFAAVLALQAQTGGGLTETLEMLADIIRRRIAMKERGHALSSEARTSSYVLGALPLVAGGLLYFASPGYIGMLFTDPLGHVLIAAAVLSLATGMGIMRLIIQRTLS
jgi:tight adherence protein B